MNIQTEASVLALHKCLEVMSNTHAHLMRGNNRHVVALRDQLERDIGSIQRAFATSCATGDLMAIETLLPMVQKPCDLKVKGDKLVAK